jgi:hypothetical protein
VVFVASQVERTMARRRARRTSRTPHRADAASAAVSAKNTALLVAIGLATWGHPSVARAQACCAGGSAVTPGRLELHEEALAGVQTRAAAVFGSYAFDGRYIGAPPSTSEYDFEEDVFGAVRVTRRGQIALLVPLQETARSTLPDGWHAGGGVGDINLSARYDFVVAGESRYVPGIALLAGVTFPTGTPVDSSTTPLAVDATGIGAFQVNAALALEQTFGPWLFNATGIVAQRTSHRGETLGTQTTLLAAGAYTFPSDIAVALAASYAFAGDATGANGQRLAFSSTRLTTLTLSIVDPLSDDWRVGLGALFNPPLSGLGLSQPASAGILLTVIRSWS